MDTANAALETWKTIGTVIGNASTDTYTFILKSLQAKLGDIVACKIDVPNLGGEGDREGVIVWGRVSAINRFNPFFPAEAAQELAEQSIQFRDTVLSSTRDHLEAEVLILGTTETASGQAPNISPLTYPVKPSAEVLQPPTEAVTLLLTGENTGRVGLRVGSLIGRPDVPVSLSAREIVSRHLAILAMTGGGKTVAARRILRELIKVRYPLVIFDPHGDYLGIYEKRDIIGADRVRLFYPRIRVEEDTKDTVVDLIAKMGSKLTDPQSQFYDYLLSSTEPRAKATATEYLDQLVEHASNIRHIKRAKDKDQVPHELLETREPTISAVLRNLRFVQARLVQMDKNNERLRHKFKQFNFEEMPDPRRDPEELVSPGQVSIFYLAGYDHLTQSAIVSIVLEQLFAHRAELSEEIPPFQAVIEEAHNFIPSRSEGTDDTPSLATIRKVITEGRKFGTGLILISQRPARLDETTLAQCNSFLVLRLVNPRDKSFVRSVMENLSESDANILQSFGKGQGLVSGQAVRFPLLVKIDFDEDLISSAIGDEDFLKLAEQWRPNANHEAKKRAEDTLRSIVETGKAAAKSGAGEHVPKEPPSKVRRKKGKGIRPAGFK
jgi:uncharacterized protein